MKKAILLSMLLFISATTITYFLVSFAVWDINAGQWSSNAREAFSFSAATYLVLSVLAGGMYHDFKNLK